MRRRAAILTISGTITSAVIYAGLLWWSLVSASPGPFRAIRTFAWHDQLGYLSMVANVANGDLGNPEPVTQTGVNHYPRAYYTAVGLVARLLDAAPITAWNLTSALLQLVAVISLALCLARVSGRPWAAFFAPVPFFTGVMSTLDPGTTTWYRPLESHAVLWGPYGVMFSNNAETAGLSLIVIAFSVVAAVWLRPTRNGIRVGLTVAAAALLGALSSFQTYSFLTGAYVAAFIIAALFLAAPGRKWWLIATGLTVPVLFIAGPSVSEAAGQLPTLVFGLLPAVPGLLRGLLRTRGFLAVYAVVFALAAAPQIVWTLSGVVSGDPFLSYRVASNVDLGVVRIGTLVASSAVVAPLALVLVAGLRRRSAPVVAMTGAIAAVWVLLSLNDVWGANAEPYRFWIDCFLLGGVATSIAIAALAGRIPVGSRVTRTRLFRAVTVACALLYVLSLVDFVRFTADTTMSATWDPDQPRAAAAAELARETMDGGNGLLTVDECIDDRTVKATSGAPMAFYYLGMAWPAERDAVQRIMDARSSGGAIDPQTADEAGLKWILRDSACEVHVRVEGMSGELMATREYGDGQSLQLWRLP